MPFYHDAVNKVVAYAPEMPDVHLSQGIWYVTARIEITRADNYTNPKTHSWAYPVRDNPQEQYIESRDSKEAAIRWFKMNRYPKMLEVDHATYLKYEKLYRDCAERNVPPKS